MTTDTIEKLVRIANQPKMIAEIVALTGAGNAGLNTIAARAVEALKSAVRA